jgi:hypothetical protein
MPAAALSAATGIGIGPCWSRSLVFSVIAVAIIAGLATWATYSQYKFAVLQLIEPITRIIVVFQLRKWWSLSQVAELDSLGENLTDDDKVISDGFVFDRFMPFAVS